MLYLRYSNSGWLVTFPKRLTERLTALGKGVEACCFFLDSNYGGKDGALKVALDYRNDAFALAGLDVDTRFKHKSSQNSMTGLLGVVPGYRVSVRGTQYVARWYSLHGIAKTEYSVFKYGMREAFRKAVSQRQEFTKVPFSLSELKRAMRVVRAMSLPPKMTYHGN